MKYFRVEGKRIIEFPAPYAFDVSNIHFSNYRINDPILKLEDRIFNLCVHYQSLAIVKFESYHELITGKYDKYGSIPYVVMKDSIKSTNLLNRLPQLLTCVFDKKGLEFKEIVYRPTLLSGNLRANYMIIGEAPGVGSGYQESVDRVLVYGPSSMLLRNSIDSDILSKCCFTNIMKYSMTKNCPVTLDIAKTHLAYLQNEIDIIKPKKLFSLGNNSWLLLTQLGIETTKIIHPTYFTRKGLKSTSYYNETLRKYI